MEPADISGRRFRTAFVIILVVAVSALFLAVTWPLLQALLLGALLAGLCHPLFRWITRLLGGRRSLGAIVTLVILFIVVAGPLSAFLGVVVQQALAVSNQAIPWVQQHFGAASTFNAHDWLVQRFPTLADHVPSQAQLVESVGAVAKSMGGFLVTCGIANDGDDGWFSFESVRHALCDVFLFQGRRENPGENFLLHAAE